MWCLSLLRGSKFVIQLTVMIKNQKNTKKTKTTEWSIKSRFSLLRRSLRCQYDMYERQLSLTRKTSEDPVYILRIRILVRTPSCLGVPMTVAEERVTRTIGIL